MTSNPIVKGDLGLDEVMREAFTKYDIEEQAKAHSRSLHHPPRPPDNQEITETGIVSKENNSPQNLEVMGKDMLSPADMDIVPETAQF